MRRCDSLPPISPRFVSFAWRYHRCVRCSSPPVPDAEPWINRELVGGISSRLARWKRQGLPSSRRNPCDHSPYSSDPGVTRQAEWGDVQARPPHGGARSDPRQREARSRAGGDEHSPSAASSEVDAIVGSCLNPTRGIDRTAVTLQPSRASRAGALRGAFEALVACLIASLRRFRGTARMYVVPPRCRHEGRPGAP